MKANKITVTITVEALSVDSTPHLIREVANHIGNGMEYTNGSLTSDDGDTVTWTATSKTVEF